MVAAATGLGACMPSLARAQAPAEAVATLDAARKDLEAVKATSADVLDDAAIQDLRRRALGAQARANEAAEALAPELAAVQARLSELGAVEAGVKESADVAAQRAELLRSVSALDSQIKLARLVAIEAEQAAAAASENRRMQLNARLEARTAAIASPAFWKQLAVEAPGDLRRLGARASDLRAAFSAVSAWAWTIVALSFAALLLLATASLRFLLKVIAARAPHGRLRRSFLALAVVIVWTLVPGLTMHLILAALESGPAMDPATLKLLQGMEGAAWFAGYAAGLGSALLMAGRPSWRLPPISDPTAHKLRWLPPVFAVAIVLGWLSSRIALNIEASATSAAALTGLGSLTFILLFAFALRRLRRRAADAQPGDAGTGSTSDTPAPKDAVSLWLPVLRGLVWTALGFSLLAALTGYLALGSFLVGQLVWGSILLGTAYLLAVLVDDLFMAVLAPTVQPVPAAPKPAGGEPDATAPAPRTREHMAVLLSGMCRIAIGFFALVLLMAPYGEGPLELFQRASNIDAGISIGEISIRPSALVQAGLVLLLGLLAVRALKRWLAQRYMPTTTMDAGMRTSLTTLTGYVGVVVVIALTMSAVGVGLERVAWVASALSVGIGFGLQAVVQNFVSGLILLAERPVKVGDWVSLAGIEGDIRRINVRATEIQMGDRSTVIVPNSEFITKIVRNVTYTDPLGMVQLKLPMPLATDTKAAKAILLEAFQAHPGILAAPAPNVQLDGIDGGNLVFVASGFVSSPRASYGARSDILFDILERLRAADLPLGRAPTMVLAPMPDLERIVQDARSPTAPPGTVPPSS